MATPNDGESDGPRLYSRPSYRTLVLSVTASKTDLVFIERAKGYAKRLEETGITKEEAGRIATYRIISSLASSFGFELPFPIQDNVNSHPSFEAGLSQEYIATHTYLLDMLFSQLVPLSTRKKGGQFVTPSPISDFMAMWGTEDSCTACLDPGVGPGALLDSVSKYASCKLTGIDTDLLPLDVASLRLKLLGKESLGKLLPGDFLSQLPEVGRPDFIISNPPYLNFHDFDSRIIGAVERRIGFRLSRLTNIYALFFYQSYHILQDGGRMAFITPSEFLYTGYGDTLKEFLLKHFTIEALALIDFSKLAFGDALTTAAITLLRKEAPALDHRVKFIKITSWPKSDELLELVAGKRSALDGCAIREVAQKDLVAAGKWQIHFGDNGMASVMRALVPMSRLASVNRGIATGANNYFTLTLAEVQKWNLEAEFLKPVISTSFQARHYNYTKEDYQGDLEQGGRSLLLYCFTNPRPNLRRYIQHGEDLKIDKRYLPAHRSPWFSSEKQEPAPILACVFSRERMRFVYNEAGVRNLTAFHCIYPSFSDTHSVKAFLAFLNSGVSAKVQEFMRREYGGGLHKFEPRDLEELLVLDVTSVPDSKKIKLADLFDKLCDASRSRNGDESLVKSEIDAEIDDILKKKT